MGIIEDVRKSVTSDFKNPGDIIYILGETRGELGGSYFEKLASVKTTGSDTPGENAFHLGKCPSLKPAERNDSLPETA